MVSMVENHFKCLCFVRNSQITANIIAYIEILSNFARLLKKHASKQMQTHLFDMYSNDSNQPINLL